MPGAEDQLSGSGNRESIPTFGIWAGGGENSTTFELSLGLAILRLLTDCQERERRGSI